MQILVFSFSHYNFVSVVIFLLFSPSLCFPSFSSFFSSAVTMRKQLCSTDNYITLRVCVCVRACGDTGRMERQTKGGWSEKGWEKKKRSSLSWLLTYTCVCSSLLIHCVFLLFSFVLILSCTGSLTATLLPSRVTGLWNVKNCSMHSNLLSCQTSPV